MVEVHLRRWGVPKSATRHNGRKGSIRTAKPLIRHDPSYSRSVDQVSAGHQRPDRQDARPQRLIDAALDRRL